MFVATATVAHAAPPVKLELATEQGLQITAPQRWLQRLAQAGIYDVRIRAAARGERPRIENIGTDGRPQYRAVGVLTARGELQLPGRTFRDSSLAQLQAYLEQVAAQGPDAMAAPRGQFGLTERQFAALLADFTQPVTFATDGQPPRAVVDRLTARMTVPVEIDTAAARSLAAAAPMADELQGLTTGTALALLLHNEGLMLRPESGTLQPVVVRITAADPKAEAWPVGWKPKQPPVELAPSLFEHVNVEIDGYTLQETLDAVAPRIKVRYYWDRAALAADHIDPNAVKITLPRTRTFYKSILNRALAQAHLGTKLRIDEAGTPFLWITR